MNKIDQINQALFGASLDYLRWLISPALELLNLSPLSLIIFGCYSLLFFSWFLSSAIKASKDSTTEIALKRSRFFISGTFILFICSVACAVTGISNYSDDNQRANQWLIQNIGKPMLFSFAVNSLIFIVLTWFSLRKWVPMANKWITKSLTKKSHHDEGISDIREIAKKIPNQKEYNPVKYWDKTKQSFFIGLDPNDKPVYVPLEEWQTQHQQVLGTTGFGKGVAVTNQLAQCLAFGESVVVFDPKNDEWAPSVLLTIAEQYNRPVCIVDLNNEMPQFNPLFGASEMEIYDLFIGGFGLSESGAESDYYRSKERRVVQQWLSSLSKDASLNVLAESLTEADFENAPKLCNDLTELAMLGCIHTNQQGAWYDILDQGGLIYVIGSVRREPVLRLQKMLLLRIMQRLEKRDRQKNHTHVTIFLDELKYLLCKPSLQALGTIRDKSANILLAHQSVNDLRDVPGDLDPEAVKSAVLENTALKIVYRSQDPETAEWIAKRSGTISAHKEMREIETTEALAEVTMSNRRLIEVERYFIEVNMVLSMPKRCSVFFSSENAQIVLTSPVRVSKRTILPTAIDTSKEINTLDNKPATKLELFS